MMGRSQTTTRAAQVVDSPPVGIRSVLSSIGLTTLRLVALVSIAILLILVILPALLRAAGIPVAAPA